MDGNARPHRTLAVEDMLESEDITRMDMSSPLKEPVMQNHFCLDKTGTTIWSLVLVTPRRLDVKAGD
ncbi:hypothetical protein TNCV_1021151 [Trichonephila clavipes]|uniref:Uncharacterized protein n=1 Tax=Trichonephila clavipes TaxID=2585209 RepID=A0A8X6SML2_TRICX|nr:hypothetical protein TNCV_1021151 [Trichonephila clavipes]